MLDQSLILKVLELAELASPDLPIYPEDAVPGHPQLAKDHVKACWIERYLKAEEKDVKDGVPLRIIGITEKGAAELKRARNARSS